MGVDPNSESYIENPYPHKRSESMPARHAARTYNKMMALRMQPETLNLSIGAPRSLCDIKMKDDSGGKYVSHGTRQFHTVKGVRITNHVNQRFEKPFTLQQDIGFHYDKATRPPPNCWYPMSSSSMTKFVDNMSQMGIKLHKK